MGVLYLGGTEITPIIESGSGGKTYRCLNNTGSNISKGDKVYIASTTNLSLIPVSNFLNTLGWIGIADENITSGNYGKVSSVIDETPHTQLALYDRVGDNATVGGFFTDGNGTKYAVCLLDAGTRQYGTGGYVTITTSTGIPLYATASDALGATESSTFLNEKLVQNAGYYYRGSTVYNGITYNWLRPSVAELNMILNDISNISACDPTLYNVSSNLRLNDNSLVFTSTGSTVPELWYHYSNRWKPSGAGWSSNNLRIDVLEIPVPNN